MHQAILMYPNVHESPECGHVGYHALQHHAGRQGSRISTPSAKLAVANAAGGHGPAFQFPRMSVTVGQAEALTSVSSPARSERSSDASPISPGMLVPAAGKNPAGRRSRPPASWTRPAGRRRQGCRYPAACSNASGRAAARP